MARSGRTANVLLLLIALASALGIGEGILHYRNSRSIRVEGRHERPSYRLLHPIYHHGLTPGSSGINARRGEYRVAYRINSLGMRDREYPPTKPKDVFRILMLGDSFTEGYSVELVDTFVKRLENRLNAPPPRTGLRYEVANLGVAGFSPLLEYLRLKEVQPKLPGDFVVLALDGSDFADDFYFKSRLDSAPDGTPLRVRPGFFLPHFLTYGRHYLETLPPPPWRDIYLLRYVTWHFIRATHDRWVQQRLGDIRYDRYGWTRPGRDAQREWREAFEDTFRHIRLVERLARSSGMGFALAAYPIGHMVHPEAWCGGRKKTFYECGKIYKGNLFEKLMRRCAEASLVCWDFTPAFAGADATRLFFDVDGHFTARGNDLMARELETRLRPLLSARTVHGAGPADIRPSSGAP